MSVPLSPVTEQLVRLAPHMQLAHHIPGRIRLRIRHSGLEAAQNIDIHDVARSVPGIRGIRLNPFNRSVVIEYDSVLFPPDLWETMLQLGSRPELLPEVRERLQRLVG